MLILLVAYLYYQNQQLKTNFRPSSPDSTAENTPWKEEIAHLQSQIDELKEKNND
jgi:hypothetical protein